MKTSYVLSLLLAMCFYVSANAQKHSFTPKGTTTDTFVTRRWHIGGALEGSTLSAATMAGGGLSTLRFSWFVNMGATANYDLNKHIGIYAGLDVKNMGFIEQVNFPGDFEHAPVKTKKYRTYNVGIPAGIKLGNLAKKRYLIVGSGFDVPVEYKEKAFVARSDKQKINEWFSDRTPHIMPYVCVGAVFYKTMFVKVQYYLNNYLNPGFVIPGGIDAGQHPYAGYDVHPILLSFGIAMQDIKIHKKSIRIK